jgi:hypothetical protein
MSNLVVICVVGVCGVTHSSLDGSWMHAVFEV